VSGYASTNILQLSISLFANNSVLTWSSPSTVSCQTT
jgi:hypothetical protein